MFNIYNIALLFIIFNIPLKLLLILLIFLMNQTYLSNIVLLNKILINHTLNHFEFSLVLNILLLNLFNNLIINQWMLLFYQIVKINFIYYKAFQLAHCSYIVLSILVFYYIILPNHTSFNYSIETNLYALILFFFSID